MDGKSLPSISFRDKTRRMSIREGVRLATHSSLPLSFESAVRKPLEKHRLHINVFDEQESSQLGAAIVDLSRLFGEEATRTLDSRSCAGGSDPAHPGSHPSASPCGSGDRAI